jgi:hypothetical protein
MSLPDSDFRELTAEEKRALLVKRVVMKAAISTGTGLVLNYGTEAFQNDENRSKIRAVFAQARTQALQKVGVLDENGIVIPGQEQYLNLRRR